jgi:hypothetical protein
MSNDYFVSMTSSLELRNLEHKSETRDGKEILIITKEQYNNGFKNIFGPDLQVKNLVTSKGVDKENNYNCFSVLQRLANNIQLKSQGTGNPFCS